MKFITKKAFLAMGSMAIVAVPIASVVSCSDDEQNSKSIAIVVSSQSNPFFQTIIDAATKAAKLKEYKVVAFDSNDKVEKEANHIDTIITGKYAGVIWNPVNAIGSKKAGAKLKGSNIPFTLVDRSLQDFEGHIAMVATDNVKAAKSVVLQALNKRITIDSIKNIVTGHLKGTEGADAAKDRSAGFAEAVTAFQASNAGHQVVIGDREKDAKFKSAPATAIVDTWSTGAGLHFIFAQNDNMALGAIKAYEGDKNFPMIVGFDGLPAAKKEVDKGKMYATVEQDADLMGQLSAQVILEVLLKDNDITTKVDYTKRNQKVDLDGVIYDNDQWPLAKTKG